jgi:DNA-binding NtrC family response regulator
MMESATVPKFTLLLVDDEAAIIQTLRRVFDSDDYIIYGNTDGYQALELLAKTRIDAALIDLKMPGMDGLALLKEIKKKSPDTMVILITGYGAVAEVVEAMKLGAVDFLEKPFSTEGIRVRVAQLREIWALREENKGLRAQLGTSSYRDLVGVSRAMEDLQKTIDKLAPTDVSILIQGETGTGKELVARAIHQKSPRSKNAFVPVDCAAINESLMESELFGHVKGAFTGAYTSSQGLLRSADKGTLFLDEVGELSLSTQAKLLRTTQEKEIRPVGDSRIHPMDVRILSATNRDLSKAVSDGQFREDLFYRLNVITIRIPPLRDRKEDIPVLAAHFARRFGDEFSRPKELSREAFLLLEQHEWPGNIRELENVIRRAIVLAQENRILAEDLPPSMCAPPAEPSEPFPSHFEGTLRAHEIIAIENALQKAGRNRRKAAKILEIGEATLYRKIRKYGLKE